MEMAVKRDKTAITEEQREVRQLVSEGLKQVREGKTMDFNTVCDRLEKKYTDATVWD